MDWYLMQNVLLRKLFLVFVKEFIILFQEPKALNYIQELNFPSPYQADSAAVI